MRIVLIEDNAMLARALAQALQTDGHAVDWLACGREGAAFLAREGADLAIIDINLPGRSGLDIIRELRARGAALPVLALTARDGLEDRVAGLDAGADDYVTKPFEIEELRARVRALGRRRAAIRVAAERFGALEFDRAARQLTAPWGPVALSRRELALWEALSDQAGRVISKAALCDRIYGTGADVEENAVELLVSRLRRKVDGGGVAIRTIRGLGYMLQTGASE
ncbi:MAG: response regulator transcription factor [Rhodobacteraceae bacterium]|nr:response regulator transcription factor [Paracoccaceae bacterium]